MSGRPWRTSLDFGLSSAHLAFVRPDAGTSSVMARDAVVLSDSRWKSARSGRQAIGLQCLRESLSPSFTMRRRVRNVRNKKGVHSTFDFFACYSSSLVLCVFIICAGFCVFVCVSVFAHQSSQTRLPNDAVSGRSRTRLGATAWNVSRHR
jgi:hypothetical protein